jgi:hypothetical protein
MERAALPSGEGLVAAIQAEAACEELGATSLMPTAAIVVSTTVVALGLERAL